MGCFGLDFFGLGMSLGDPFCDFPPLGLRATDFFGVDCVVFALIGIGGGW